MKKIFNQPLSTAGLALGAFAMVTLAAQAAVIPTTTITEVTSRSVFNSQTSGRTTDDFESPGATLTTDFVDVNPAPRPGYTTPIGTFTSTDSIYYSNSPATGLSDGDGSYYVVPSPNGNMLLTLNAGIVAAGSDLFDVFVDNSPLTMVVTETDGVDFFTQSFTINVPLVSGSLSGSIFEGFVASAGDTLVSIQYFPGNGDSNARYDGLDNFSVATGLAAAPEPSTYALMGMGLAGLAIAARKRKIGKA